MKYTIMNLFESIKTPFFYFETDLFNYSATLYNDSCLFETSREFDFIIEPNTNPKIKIIYEILTVDPPHVSHFTPTFVLRCGLDSLGLFVCGLFKKSNNSFFEKIDYEGIKINARVTGVNMYILKENNWIVLTNVKKTWRRR